MLYVVLTFTGRSFRLEVSKTPLGIMSDGMNEVYRQDRKQEHAART